MTQLVKSLRVEGWDEVARAKADQYIRINGESMRAVSLADGAALCQYHTTSNNDASKVIAHFNGQPKILDLTGKNKKPERRLQAYLIKQALMNNRSLLGSHALHCLNCMFDELLFALDEVSFGDNKLKVSPNVKKSPAIVRLDLLAVGIKDGIAFPVIIELKTDRHLKRLGEQLANAEAELVENNERILAVTELLNSVTVAGIKAYNKDSNICKILVWPRPLVKESKLTTQRMATDPILTKLICVEYEEISADNSLDFHPANIRYQLRQ